MNFVEAIKSGYQNYVNFSGRSSRSAFWWWVLFQIIVGVAIAAVEGGGASQMGDGMMEASYNAGPVGIIWSLANLLPGIAVSVRRMHDIGKSGWWVLISVIPLIGWIIYLVWACQKGTDGTNRFGDDPLAGRA